VEQIKIKADRLMGCIFYIIFISFGLSCLFACNNPQSEASKLLEDADYLLKSKPNSTMTLIDSIFYPEKSLSRGNYMRFLVLQVQANI
jgi:hypothetical protein